MSIPVPMISTPTSSQAKSPDLRARPWTLGAWLAAAALVALATANLTHDRIFHRESAGAAAPTVAVDPKPTHDPTTTVVLPEGKFQQAEIRVEPTRAVDLPREVAVTGKIEADPNRRVDIRPKAGGVVRTVPVAPGSKVKKGDTLVVLDSPDVGSSRLRVRERQRELATVRVEAAWKAEIATNARAMIAQLREGVEAQALIKRFAGKTLGAARGTLISAFAELEIAAHEQEKQAELRERKITGEHLLFVAQHTREGAQARFDATLQTVEFQASQDDRVARQAVRNAEEMVVDAAQRLRILGVTEDINDLLDHPERASSLPSGAEDVVSYPVVAPFDGTILATSAVVSQRVEPVDVLFLLADLTRVHAVANVPESDFAALPGLAGAKVGVTATAYPARAFDSKILYVGSSVDPITRTVRLVTETDNPDGLLKLGMFARIVLDSSTTEAVPTVPVGSVVEVEGKPAVFVPREGERTFKLRLVKLGREALGRQVIVEGLKAGEPVVVAGAFLIKSELLLQQESGED